MGDLAHIVAGQIIGRLTGWLADPKHGGGALFYVGVHAIYQVLHVIERRAERVFAHVTMSDSGVDESCTLTIDFEGGLSAQIVTSQRFDGRYGWLDVIGTQGRVRSEWERQELTVQSNVLEAYRHETVIHVPEDCIGPDVEAGDAASVMAHKYIRAWASEFQQFIAAIREDHDPPVSGTHAVDVLKITDAVLDSGRRGTPVELA